METELQIAQQAVDLASTLMRICQRQQKEIERLTEAKEDIENEYFDHFLEQIVDDAEQ